MLKKTATYLSAAAALLGVASPAFAQAPGSAPAASLPSIVPDCRKERAGGEIVVCGRPDDQRSRFELPVLNDRFDPNGEMESVSRERHSLYEVGDTGIHSCSTVGPGGYTGCDFIRWKGDREQDADKNIARGERPQRGPKAGISLRAGPIGARPFGE
jgi:hypothetical protein